MILRDWLREARILDGFFGLGAYILRLRGPAPRRRRSRLSPTKKYYRPEFDQLEVREMPATLTGITEYTIPTASSGPKGITYGPDGLIWAVESSTNKVFKTTATGSFTEYSVPTANSQPYDICAGSDGNLWGTENAGNKIFKITTSGTFSEYTITTSSSGPRGITPGPDGNLWFVEQSVGKIGKITTSGTITEYTITGVSGTIQPEDIVAGPDDNLWYTEVVNPPPPGTTHYIGKVTTSGSFSHYAIPTSSASPFGITKGPEGNLWFSEFMGNKIGRITTSGVITEYTIPNAGTGPKGIATGADGNIYFAESSANAIGKIDPESGAFVDQGGLTASASSFGITAGPNGSIWVSENSGNRVAKYQWATGGTAPVQVFPYTFGPATISPIDGNVTIGHPLYLGQSTPSPYDPPFPAALVYNVNTVNVKPILVVPYQSDPDGSVPSSIDVTLTWNGSAQSAVNFATTGHSAGDLYLFSSQVSSAVSSTGFYSWSVEVKAYFGADNMPHTLSGSRPVVVNGDTPFGHGWGIAGLDKLVTVTGGVLWVYGAGGASFFSGSSGTYVSPSYDFGTLVKNGDNTFTYTAKDQVKYYFGTDGLETKIVAPNTLTTTFTYASSRISTIKGPDGGTATFTYDGNNQLNKIETPGSRVYTITHDATSKDLTAIQDPDSNRTTFTYDSSHRMTNELMGNISTTFQYSGSNGELTTVSLDASTTLAVTPYNTAGLATSPAINASAAAATFKNALNQTTTMTFDRLAGSNTIKTADGAIQTWNSDFAQQPTRYQDPLNNVTTFAYTYGSSAGDLTKITNPDATTKQFQYDSTFHKPTVLVDELGNRTTMTYDGTTGEMLTTKDALNNVTTLTYAAGRLSTIKDPLTNVTTFLYDSSKRPETVIDALANRTTSFYDAAGHVTGVRDANSNLTQFLMDAMGRVTATVDALGNRTTSLYDAAGLLTGVRDGNNNLTQFLYDSAGRHTVTIDAASNRTTSYLDSAGNLTGVKDAKTNLTQFLIDAVGRATVTIDPLSNRTTSYFDAAGNLTGVKDGRTNLTQFLYDALNRATVTIDPLSNRTTSYFDAAGNMTGVKDANTNLTQFLYDALNRQTATIDALGNRTTSYFDAAGNLTGLKDASNNLTTFAYDAVNRNTSTTDPAGKTATFAYDAVGLMTGTTDRLGRKQEFTFDAANRLTRTVWKNSGGTAVETMTHSYDANGNDLVATNSQGTYTMTYDALNRVTVVNDLWGKTLTFTYDAVGNRTKVADSANGVLTSTYDAGNNLTRLEFGGSGQTPLRTDFAYNADNMVETISRYSDLAGNNKVATSTFTYDAANQLTNLQTKDASNNNIANYTYTYDAADRVTTQVLNSTTTTYAYDTTDQLTGDGATTVTYDGTGNRNNGGYTTTTGNKMTSDGTYNYTYDDEGNTTRKTKISDSSYWTYVYDNENHLTEAAQYNSSNVLQKKVALKYDVFGNRDQKYFDSNGDGTWDTTQRYAYDGWNPAKGTPLGTENFDIWADLDGSSSLTTRYLRADLVDQLMARIDSGTAYWELGDRLGSIGHVIDNNGTVKDAITYDGWGNATHSNSAFAGRYLWTGREWDTETSLQYNRARYYDPATGRWITQDPLGLLPDSNPYRYVGNTPTNLVDPSGYTISYPTQAAQAAAIAQQAAQFLANNRNIRQQAYEWLLTQPRPGTRALGPVITRTFIGWYLWIIPIPWTNVDFQVEYRIKPGTTTTVQALVPIGLDQATWVDVP